MTATATFRFSNNKFTLRPAGEDDFYLAEKWTQLDPEHRGSVDPRFWLEQAQGRDSFLLFDDEGPVFFFKMVLAGSENNRAIEIHIQFPPQGRNGYRIAAGLIEGITWLERVLRQIQIREMFFDSASRKLITFAIKRLGFRMEGGKLRKRLA